MTPSEYLNEMFEITRKIGETEKVLVTGGSIISNKFDQLKLECLSN